MCTVSTVIRKRYRDRRTKHLRITFTTNVGRKTSTNPLSTFSRAAVAQPLHHVVNAVERETPRKGHRGDMDSFQTKGSLTGGAVKMNVQVVNATIALTTANGIFQRARPVVNGVNQVMLQEESDGSREGRFVYRIEISLKVEQGECLLKLRHCFENQQPQGCWFNVSLA